MIEHIWWAVKVIAIAAFGFSALAGVSAVILDMRQRRHQRSYFIANPPSLKDCDRRYTP